MYKSAGQRMYGDPHGYFVAGRHIYLVNSIATWGGRLRLWRTHGDLFARRVLHSYRLVI